MPPLKAARQFEQTPEQVASQNREFDARRKVYERMLSLLPDKPSKKSSGRFISAKAVYKVDGQSEAEYTRAWVQKTIRSDTIDVMTDRVTYQHGVLVKVQDSEYMHFAIGKLVNVLYSDHYGGMSGEQQLELMQSAQDTLDLIEQANFAQAASS